MTSPAQRKGSAKTSAHSSVVGRQKPGLKKNKDSNNRDQLKEKLTKLHKFEAKEKNVKSPKKPLLKSKEEGQVLGLPQEEKKSEKEEEVEDEPSIYFYEDDEDELENLARKCLPILTELSKQIDSFDLYNGMNEFKKEHHFQHTFIKDHREEEEAYSRVTSKTNKRSSIGVRKSAKKSNISRTSHDHSTVHPHKEYNNYDLCKLQETVTGMLGVKRYEDWILNLNIGNVMHLSPLGLQEMNLQLDNSHELTRDAILEKIVLLSIAYFCVGTELRFLSQSKNKNKESQILRTNSAETEKYTKKESEKWQAKAVETSCTFLPSD